MRLKLVFYMARWWWLLVTHTQAAVAAVLTQGGQEQKPKHLDCAGWSSGCHLVGQISASQCRRVFAFYSLQADATDAAAGTPPAPATHLMHHRIENLNTVLDDNKVRVMGCIPLRGQAWQGPSPSCRL